MSDILQKIVEVKRDEFAAPAPRRGMASLRGDAEGARAASANWVGALRARSPPATPR